MEYFVDKFPDRVLGDRAAQLRQEGMRASGAPAIAEVVDEQPAIRHHPDGGYDYLSPNGSRLTVYPGTF